MRSQDKSPEALPKPSILENSGRVTRSRAAHLSAATAVSLLTIQAASARPSHQVTETPTTTSSSVELDASDLASLSSSTSTFEYADDSGSASSDHEEADVHVASSSEYSETSSGGYPNPPAAKRIKVLDLPKPEMVPEEPTKPPPPNRQIKLKDAWNFKSGVNEKLPPINNIVEIFDDLTRKAIDLGLGEAIQHLGPRKLKLATMCSGTESPLLALQLVSESKYKRQTIRHPKHRSDL